MQTLARMTEHPQTESTGRLLDHAAEGEEVLIQVSTDLDEQAEFGQRWLVVTPGRVIVVPVDGTDGGLLSVAVVDIRHVRNEMLVGGGLLAIEPVRGDALEVFYTASMAPKFAEVARGLEQLRDGRPMSINPELERMRCARCNRLLPEKNGICPACVHKLATLRRIASYVLPYRWRVLVLGLAAAAVTAAELLPPMITRRIVDDVLVPADPSPDSMDARMEMLGLLVLALIGVRLSSWAAEWMHGWIMAWMGARVTADIRSQLYRRMEMLSLQFYDKRQVGALMSRVTRDAGRLHEFLVDGLPYLVINGLMVLGILGFLVYLSWELSLYILVPVPLMLFWGAFFWKRMRRYFHRWGESWEKLTERTNEALNGIRVVKAFAQEKREIRSFSAVNQDLREVAVATQLNRGIFFATMTFLTGLGVLIVWLLGGRQVLLEQITLGTLLAFYSFMWMFYGPLEWVAQVNTWMSQSFAGAERIFEVIDALPEAYDDPGAQRLPRLQGSIRFNRVSFGYDKSKPVLRDIDLNVEPGQMIGLVGRSGVGKTTLVNLVTRFYDVDQGEILIDGIDIRQINLRDLRRQIGIVSQDPVLFSGTIADNIGYGNPGAGFQDIMDAARIANAHNFIMAKSDAYETQVGERGIGLSGGERQRLAIARAVLHDPRILILDEATSSVDVETETQIQQAMAKLTRGRTTIAIAHRLSTLRHAQRIVVLDQGRIVETGSHAELIALGGVFSELVRLQKEADEIIAIRN